MGFPAPGIFFIKLPGSLVNGAFLNGGPDSLAAGSLNSPTPGRYDFQVRNAQVLATTPEPMSIGLFAMGLAALLVGKKRVTRR